MTHPTEQKASCKQLNTVVCSFISSLKSDGLGCSASKAPIDRHSRANRRHVCSMKKVYNSSIQRNILSSHNACFKGLSKSDRSTFDELLRRASSQDRFCCPVRVAQATLAGRVGVTREWMNQGCLAKLENIGFIGVRPHQNNKSSYTINPVFFTEKGRRVLSLYSSIISTHGDLLQKFTCYRNNQEKTKNSSSLYSAREKSNPILHDPGGGMNPIRDILSNLSQDEQDRGQKLKKTASNPFVKSAERREYVQGKYKLGPIPKNYRPRNRKQLETENKYKLGPIPKGYRSIPWAERKAKRRKELAEKYSSRKREEV